MNPQTSNVHLNYCVLLPKSNACFRFSYSDRFYGMDASQLPIRVVQQLAGHSDIAATRKYYLTVQSQDIVFANKVLKNLFAKVKAV
ncbi:MAG TPA: hypothetical protein VMW72_01175 [Sedimentisphaerales bacterium]|nr:hypothetical protein [Sedimentisphaerales bacterium]